MNAIEILRELAARKQRARDIASAIAKHFDITDNPRDRLRRDLVQQRIAGELRIDVWWRARREMTQALELAGARRGSVGGASYYRCIKARDAGASGKAKAPASNEGNEGSKEARCDC